MRVYTGYDWASSSPRTDVQEREFRAWRIGNTIDDDTVVIFPELGQTVHIVAFMPNGGTEHVNISRRELGDQGTDAGGPS